MIVSHHLHCNGHFLGETGLSSYFLVFVLHLFWKRSKWYRIFQGLDALPVIKSAASKHCWNSRPLTSVTYWTHPVLMIHRGSWGRVLMPLCRLSDASVLDITTTTTPWYYNNHNPFNGPLFRTSQVNQYEKNSPTQSLSLSVLFNFLQLLWPYDPLCLVDITHTTVLWPFFRDYLGEPVPEEIFCILWCKGR